MLTRVIGICQKHELKLKLPLNLFLGKTISVFSNDQFWNGPMVNLEQCRIEGLQGTLHIDSILSHVTQIIQG